MARLDRSNAYSGPARDGAAAPVRQRPTSHVRRESAGMKLQSGPALADRNYWVFVALLCIGFAGYFVYDGARGWPEENRKKARAQFEQINAELASASR